MMDGTALMIVGIAAQAAMPAHKLFAFLKPRLRGPSALAAIIFTPLPHAALSRNVPPATAGLPVIADR
jgi:hypothetical protein